MDSRSEGSCGADTVVLPVSAHPGAVEGELRIGARRTRSTVLIALALVVVATVGVGYGFPRQPTPPVPVAIPPTPIPHANGLRRRQPPPSDDGKAAVGEADGVVPDGVTVFDDDIPAVADLDPGLLDALRRAAKNAGVEFSVNSGWRSPAYQEQLLSAAVAKYGSRAEAARWVSTPQNSLHVSGHAVDIGTSAAAWLSQHGAAYGLCQIYRNEPWHYELRPDAVDDGCPPSYADPTHDPRMQK